MYISIEILRVIACLLIVNFHCLDIYPESLKILSFGGDIGNNTFFVLSGFLLASSIERTSYKNIWGGYLRKRFFKIIPICLFFNLMGYIFIQDRVMVGEWYKCFVFPTVFWFTGAIVIFYPLIYFVGKIKENWLTICLVFVLIIVHLIFDSLSAERYVMGFIAMVCGLNLKKHWLKKYSIKHPRLFLLIAPVIFACYGFLKIIYAKGMGPQRIIHLMIGILTIMLAVFLLVGLYGLEDLLKTLKHYRWIHDVISTISNMTLTIYLCQSLINFTIIGIFNEFVFPLSLIIYLLCTFLISYLVYLVDNVFREKIFKV